MKSAPRSRLFITICSIYLLFVAAAFLFGLLMKEEHGVSFIPAVLLTLPWFYVLPCIAELLRLFPVLTAYYDLPLFATSAF
jgi:hypothetical protein